MSYHRNPVKAPRMAGLPLRAFVGALESGVGGAVIDKVTKDSGIDEWRGLDPGADASPIQVPLPWPPAQGEPVASAHDLAARALKLPSRPGLETIAAFNEAYRGSVDPVSVARRLHDAIDRLDGRDERMGFFIARKPDQVLKAAEAAAERWKKGQPLSPLDGVPVVVKDELDMAGFATTLGTSFRTTVAERDSTVVARLKAAGAVILGKANMHELGMSPVAVNAHHGPTRNPYNRAHITGGSSSGSAATVAAGLCPVAIGADGGGSIRIPAALCGVVGLKATFGRISEAGVPPLCWNPGHVGPIGLTVADVAVAYALIAGPDEHDYVSQRQPAPTLAGLENGALDGVRLGIAWRWFEDADDDVVRRCKEAVTVLTKAGAKVVEIPPPDMNTVLWTHATIIWGEMAASMRQEVLKDRTRFSLDTRTNLAIGAHFRAIDLIHAMRHRHMITRRYLEILKGVDVIVTPTVACTAPEIPEANLPEGESNLPVVSQAVRFAQLGNLTGFPALSVPAGYDSKGLPIGLQLMGRPYEENLLLRLGLVVEKQAEHRVPAVHANALGSR